jgi:hypothetical protein
MYNTLYTCIPPTPHTYDFVVLFNPFKKNYFYCAKGHLSAVNVASSSLENLLKVLPEVRRGHIWMGSNQVCRLII